jgi:hypothetical protein
VGRPFYVYDNDGDYLGSFATWAAAHDWAHLQIAVGSMAAPLEIEDRRTRSARRIWADRCALTFRSTGDPAWELATGDHLGDTVEHCAPADPRYGSGYRTEGAIPAPPSLAGPPAPRRPTA